MTVDWRHLPSLATLRAFQATAQHGGFTGAGRALNVTHAAVAQQVRALERELGVPLVQRLGRAVSLTPQGERLAQTLSDGFTTIAGGIAALLRAEQRRGLRVATTTYLAPSLILPRLPEFLARHPGIEVSMTPSQDTVDLVRDGFDIAIRGWQTVGPGLQSIHLAQSRLLIAGAPSLLGNKPANILTLPWILGPGPNMDREILQQAGIDVDRLRTVNVGSARLEIPAAVLGLGLTLSTEVVLRSELAGGQLREVAVPELTLPVVNYYAILPVGPVRAATQAFVDWVRSLF
jgi:LysR family transcriptional regulator, glycine cleavage system transcriptional activator